MRTICPLQALGASLLRLLVVMGGMLFGVGGRLADILAGNSLVLVVVSASRCSGGCLLGWLHDCWVWEAAGVEYRY